MHLDMRTRWSSNLTIRDLGDHGMVLSVRQAGLSISVCQIAPLLGFSLQFIENIARKRENTEEQAWMFKFWMHNTLKCEADVL